MSTPPEQGEPFGIAFHDAQQTFTIHGPKLISLAYTAVYDTGAVQVGAVVPDGSGKPLAIEFKNARGQASPL